MSQRTKEPAEKFETVRRAIARMTPPSGPVGVTPNAVFKVLKLRRKRSVLEVRYWNGDHYGPPQRFKLLPSRWNTI